MTASEPMARVSISRILEKVTAMESSLAVQACAIQALAEDMKSVRTDVAGLQGDRFPWKVIGGIVGLGALIVSIVVAMTSGVGGPPPPPR